MDRPILATIPAIVLMAGVSFAVPCVAQDSDFSLNLHANSHATAKDIGLPEYPGATLFKDKGAKRRDVLLLILRNASVLVVSGLGLGLMCTWIATRLLKSFLFSVGQHDPFTVVTVSLLLVVCGLMAAFVPARRAASIDPMQALRTE